MFSIPLIKRRTLRALVVTGAAVGVVAASTITADAAVSFTATNLAVSVSGTSVTASAKITAGTTTTVDNAKICVRDQDGRNVDFGDASGTRISSAGTWVERSGTFAPGTYSYWACAQVDGVWWDGDERSFTVGGTTAAASGAAMPSGDLPGWDQVFTEDFTTPVARGSFPGPYAGKWISYDGFTDTSKAGDYDADTIAVQDGVLDINLGPVNGRPKGAAPVPLVDGRWGGQTYGRFSVRMRSDAIPGYGTGFLLWPDSDDWRDGEIDFPESSLSGVVKGYNHCLGNGAAKNCLVVDTTARYTDWHTYTIDWTPGRLSFLIDDRVVGTTTSNVSSERLHWVMQVATTGEAALARANSGHLQIDWATIYTYRS